MRPSLPDVNVWLALSLGRHEGHGSAIRWLDTVDQPSAVAFCGLTQVGYLRLLTTAAVFAPFGLAPLTNRDAWAAWTALLADDRIVPASDEPRGLRDRWRTFAERDTASPKLWTDAYLAAFAVCAGHRLVTFDAGFRQFEGLDLLVL